jgi:hypothetical protein
MLRALQIAALICVATCTVDGMVAPDEPTSAQPALLQAHLSDGAFTSAESVTLIRVDEHSEDVWALAPQKLQSRVARTTSERAAGATGAAQDIRRARSSAARRYEPLPDSTPSRHALGLGARGLRLKN